MHNNAMTRLLHSRYRLDRWKRGFGGAVTDAV